MYKTDKSIRVYNRISRHCHRRTQRLSLSAQKHRGFPKIYKCLEAQPTFKTADGTEWSGVS